ncbi:hypothetical protein V1264_002169 [Littorina saxatilis]|uniref:Apple domain-containing protein n=2 Tax=Littorina saxatilis TaxID=31220 RepID=A0AAN9C374_9CAEN
MDRFQRYHGSYLLAPILDITSDVSERECMTICSTNRECLGFNYYERKRDTSVYYCYMVSKTARMLPLGSFVLNFTECDYYQRHCV